MRSGNPVFKTPEEQATAAAEFVNQHAHPYDDATDNYDRPPFSSDVKSPGRSDFYNLHYYLTKVPPESIVGLLLHYTKPGDLVFDPFCGSGMTGVACQMCTEPDPAILAENPLAEPGPRTAVLSDLSPAACHLSYNYTHPVVPDLVKQAFATIVAEVKDKIDALYSTDHFEPARGLYSASRPEVAAMLGDTSNVLMSSTDSETGEWQLVSHHFVKQYLGLDSPSDSKPCADDPSSYEGEWIRIPAILTYVVWSDVYRCEGFKTIEEPTNRINSKTGKRVMRKQRVARGCRQEIVARGTDDKAEDDGNNAFLRCPHCDERWMKGRLPRIKIIPVEEVYEYDGLVNANGGIASKRLRATRLVSRRQCEHISNLRTQSIPCWFPQVSVNKQGPRYRRDSLAGKNINTYSDFFTHRNLWAMAVLWDAISRVEAASRSALQFCFTSQVMRCSRLRRMKGQKPGEQLSGTLHIASETVETNVLRIFEKAVENYLGAVATARPGLPQERFVHLSSATDLRVIPNESVDYVFTDPPFGSNIYYSEVTFMWEAWLGRFTDEAQEAVMHRPVDGGYKRLEHYAALMDQAFGEIYRILKPGRWATVEFNNSDGKVFEVIKAGLVKVGFHIQNMLVFDKVERTYAQIRSTTGVSDVVDKDVLFNAVKPISRGTILDAEDSDLEHAVADAVRLYLTDLPAKIQANREKYGNDHRTTATLNSMLMNTLIPKGMNVQKLNLRLIERVCGRYFRKVGQRWYLRGEAVGTEVNSPSLIEEEIRIVDELTAIQWLRQKLSVGSVPLGELKPLWMRATGLLPAEVSQHLVLEDLLSENFWRDKDTNRWREPTDDEREKMNDDRSIRVLHDSERYISGNLRRNTTDSERCDWIDVLFQACRAIEDGDTEAISALRGFDRERGYRLVARLFQSVLREKVTTDEFLRAQKQAAVASQKISNEIEAHAETVKTRKRKMEGPTLFDDIAGL